MITTSNFATPGSYYGEAYNNLRFVIEVKRNTGINFYIEGKSNTTKFKSFSDKEIRWESILDSNSSIVSYKTQELKIEEISFKLKYNLDESIFELYAQNNNSVITGFTSKVYLSFLKNINNLSPPNSILTSSAKNSTSNITKIIFFIIAFIVSLVLSGSTAYYFVNRLLFSLRIYY